MLSSGRLNPYTSFENRFKIAVDESIPLLRLGGATALERKVPVIVSNNKHIRKLAGKMA